MRVFVSYAHQDGVRARAVAACIRDVGHGVFIDDRLEAGATFRSTLEEELRAADAVVVLWTKASIRSSWVHEEASLARTLRTLRPVAFGVDPPLGFRELHTPRCELTAEPTRVVAALGLTSGVLPPPVAERAPVPTTEDWYRPRSGGRFLNWITKPR